MIEIAICDDEVYMASEIEEMLWNLCESYNVKVEIDVFYDGSTLVDYIEKGANYDIIYLDIEMKQKNGVEAARRIRRKDTNVLIIYVTSHESFAKEVFEVSAYRFITKPIDKEIFEKYFLSAIDTVRIVPVYYRYQYNKIHYKLLIDDIIYFRSDKRITYIVTVNGEEKCYDKLNNIEKKLHDFNVMFFRTHQSFLVNPKYVVIYMYDSMTLSDGSVISISIKRRKDVNKQYCLYVGDKIIG
jgi:DNA-binding LytR/AlgR family response regulator